ncbi:MAG TPA: molecular chaperone TorD family protein [Blastocatellia bacterium]|nr:molecular chaperone TorD family protein [Blastocatellia bacterium]HMV87348.1 molecular chaperone TorD family protein [Blastocatellia bacterium]HMX25692.1 molecular chaperone TorD family protein [Blastocatellia bacterium]HMY75775.1 molecular chaperone TorD family protein [Blastocatellia bacterium]HMZ20628.1 molecular chaperone TorD family protein [Blastocatellia bacterium]
MIAATATVQNQLLREAAEWRLLGLLFECPSPSWREQIESLATEVSDADLSAAVETARREASEGLYHSIFGPGGPAPGREISYRDWTQPGYLLSELTSYYDAFAYEPAIVEAPDHVSVETGFVAYLKLKEAYAEAMTDDEHAAVTREAAQQFVKEHLSMMTEPLARSLEHSGVEYLALAGKALLARVGSKPEQNPKQSLPIFAGDEDSEFACAEV